MRFPLTLVAATIGVPLSVAAAQQDIPVDTSPRIVFESNAPPARYQLLRRTPIVFVPFDTINPLTHRAASQDSTITLPNGKSMTLRAFYAEANRIERALNQIGYSLRDTTSRRPLLRARTNVNLINQQMLLLRPAAGKLPFQEVPLPQRNAWLKALPQQPTPMVMYAPQALQQTLPVPVSDTAFQWSRALGDPSIVRVEAAASEQTSTAADRVSAGFQGTLSGSLLGNNIAIFATTLTLKAPKDGNAEYHGGIEVLGNTVASDNEAPPVSSAHPTAGGTWARDYSLPLPHPTASYYWPVIPGISVKVTWGLRGTARLKSSATVYSRGVGMWVDPRLSVDASATASINAIVAEAGVGANINVFGFDTYAEVATSARDYCSGPLIGVTNCGSVLVTPFTPAAVGHRKLYFARNTHAGGGELYVYVTIYYPCWDWPPECSSTYDHTILDWDGFQYTTIEINRQRYIKLSAPTPPPD